MKKKYITPKMDNDLDVETLLASYSNNMTINVNLKSEGDNPALSPAKESSSIWEE